jgi:radical SAM superfamily enzyme
VYSPSKSGLLWEIKEEKLEARTKVLELPEAHSKNHVAFAKKHTELVKRYNEAFVKVGGEEKYLERLGKYIDVSKL